MRTTSYERIHIVFRFVFEVSRQFLHLVKAQYPSNR